MLILSEPWIFFYYCSIMSFSFSLNICFYFGENFPFFLVVFVGRVLCVVIHLLHSSLVLFILGVLGSWEFSGGPGHVFFLRGAPLWRMSVRYNLFERQRGWVAGLYRRFLLLGSVEAVRYD